MFPHMPERLHMNLFSISGVLSRMAWAELKIWCCSLYIFKFSFVTCSSQASPPIGGRSESGVVARREPEAATASKREPGSRPRMGKGNTLAEKGGNSKTSRRLTRRQD